MKNWSHVADFKLVTRMHPNSKIFISSVASGWGEDGYIASEFTRNINQVKTISHDDFVFINSHYFHEFDRALACSGLAPNQMCDRMVSDVISNKRHHGTDANLLSRKWEIGLRKAKDTIAKTTQLNIRSALLPLTRRYRTDLLPQRLKRLSTRFYTDTAYSKIGDSIQGNTCVQIFTDGDGSIFAYPLKSKADCGDSLQELCSQVGVPRELH